jgi:Cu(I)/Ag(I) efflux system membrane protein CusA/SilA
MTLEMALDPVALTRHAVELERARSIADVLVGDGRIGELDKDGRSVPVRVVLNATRHGLADRLRSATVRGSGSGPVPLALLGRPAYVARPAVVRTEHGQPVGYLYVDLAGGTDIRSYIANAQAELRRARQTGELRLLASERLEWAGQHELLLAGERRLQWIVPIVVLLMLGLLIALFRSLAEALIVLASIPFALVGSVWILFLLDYALSPPVWVGMLSVIGLAMQTAVVMVVYIDDAFHRRLRAGEIVTRQDIVAAHAEGTVQRLRPKIMTVATMAAALLPLLWTEGAGSEIMRRVAAPMVGGLATSAFLTLEVLPVLYTIWRNGQLRRARRLGIPLATVIGRPPSWARRAKSAAHQ